MPQPASRSHGPPWERIRFSIAHCLTLLFNLCCGFRPAGELLFFLQQKKSNQKNAAPEQLALRVPESFSSPTRRFDYKRRPVVCLTGELRACKFVPDKFSPNPGRRN